MRLPLVLLLILALFTSPLAPARAEWSCPDGTPCVASGKQVFESAGGQCRIRSCCETPHARRCDHGAWPGLAVLAPSESQFQSPDHCRFHQSDPPQLTATHDHSQSLRVADSQIALLPTRFQLPQGVVSHTHWLVDHCGDRPPPLQLTGPSRAPPLA